MRLEFRYEQNFYIGKSENKTTEVNTVMMLGPVTTGSTTLTNERSCSGSRAQSTAQYMEPTTLCVTNTILTQNGSFTWPTDHPHEQTPRTNPHHSTHVRRALISIPLLVSLSVSPLYFGTRCAKLSLKSFLLVPTSCVTDSLPIASKVNISTKIFHNLKNSQHTVNSRVNEEEISPPVCEQDEAQTTQALTRSARATIRPALQLFTSRALPARCQYASTRRQHRRGEKRRTKN
ncbi:hypothetical protein FHG87_009347 [Trinorchestia longiramus]|nr:hypothetical protein FHG87_009347 [Trinorchestia longiramus]